jgi:hypothetical protein
MSMEDMHTAVGAAMSVVRLVVVWPLVPSFVSEGKLWEHLQRFAWTDDRLMAVREARDAESGSADMEKVNA